MARSQILGNTAWLFMHFVFLPLFLELSRGHDVCHTMYIMDVASGLRIAMLFNDGQGRELIKSQT